MIKPILKYPGAKWRIAPWIISHFPEHVHYVEPYCGSAAVFLSKAPSEHEILNDLSGSIVNFFRVVRDHGEELAWRIAMTPWAEEEYRNCELSYEEGSDEVERARRFLVRCWQAHGVRFRGGKGRQGWKHNGLTGHQYPALRWRNLPERVLAVIDRLQGVEIRCQPALNIIADYKDPKCLLYVDPPYPLSTRNDRYYEHEMTDEDHAHLLELLDKHSGPVVLSGYEHPLYNARLRHWTRLTAPAIAEHGPTSN